MLEGAGLCTVTQLIKLVADFRCVPLEDFLIVCEKDGQYYDEVNFAVEVTWYSAYTKYELVNKGINYGAVSAEYV